VITFMSKLQSAAAVKHHSFGQVKADYEPSRVILPIPYEATTTYRQGCCETGQMLSWMLLGNGMLR